MARLNYSSLAPLILYYWSAAQAEFAAGTALSIGGLSTSTTVMTAVVGGAVGGATAGAAGALLAGGSGNDILRAGFRGGVTGGIMSGTTALSGDWNTLGRITARSTAAGISAELQGGRFSDGFQTTFGIETLNWAALGMRASMVSQSCQGGNNPNCSGQSAGFMGDGVKLGGARCIEGGGCPSNLLGGVQGGQGTFFGFEYQPGSFRDRLVEAFGGPHDFLNSFMYNPSGNLNPAYASGIGGAFGEAVSWLNVVPASVFTAGSVAQPLLPYAYALGQR